MVLEGDFKSKNDVDEDFAEIGEDRTEPVEHFAGIVPLTQNRGLGYLPATESRKVVEDCVRNWQRPRRACKIEKARALHEAVAGIPTGVVEQRGEECFKFALSKLEIGLKARASVLSTVAEGGRLRDAQHLFGIAKKRQWKIPIRSWFSSSTLKIRSLPDKKQSWKILESSRITHLYRC